MKAVDPFYRSARWLKLRAAVLRRDGYMCAESKRYGLHKQADTVHHVFPRDLFPEYQWEPWNLVSLCAEVHDRMHDRVTGELTRRGVMLLKRIAKRQGMEVPTRYR